MSCGPVSPRAVSMFFSDVRFLVLVISSFICCRVGEVGSLDLRSSRALIVSNISARTGYVLTLCRPEGIRCDAVFRMMVTQDLFSFLAVCWNPSFAQFILDLPTISVPVCFL